MGDRPRPDLYLRDLVVLAVEREAILHHSLANDERTFDEAIARFLHVDTKSVVLYGRRAAPEAEDRASAGKHIQQRDVLGDLHRIVPWQHDHRGPELNPLSAAGYV